MFLILETTTNSKKIAKEISDHLVLNRLSRCVQLIDKISSTYIWKNKVVRDKEILIRIKVKKSKIDKTCKSIKKIHNYLNPELISYNIDINSNKYLRWLKENPDKCI